MARIRCVAAGDTAPSALRADALFGLPNVPAFSEYAQPNRLLRSVPPAARNQMQHHRDDDLDSSSEDERVAPAGPPQAAQKSTKPVIHPPPRKRQTTTSAEDLFDSFLQHRPAEIIPASSARQRSGQPSAQPLSDGTALRLPQQISNEGRASRTTNPFQLIDDLCDHQGRRSSAESTRRSGLMGSEHAHVPAARGSSDRKKARDLLDLLDEAAPETSHFRDTPAALPVSSSRSPMNPLTARIVDQLNRSFDSWRCSGFPKAVRCRAVKITVAFHVGVVLAVAIAVDDSTISCAVGDALIVLVQYETFCTSRIVPGCLFDIGRPFLFLPQAGAKHSTLVASFCIRQAIEEVVQRGDVASVLAYDPLRVQPSLAAATTRPVVDTSATSSDFFEGPGPDWFVSLHVLQELLSSFEGSRGALHPAAAKESEEYDEL